MNDSFNQVTLTELFRLHGADGKYIFSIKPDGSVDVNPQCTAKEAVDEFWKWIANDTNMIQLAVNQAKQEERSSIIEQIQNQGNQWAVMRSMKMTDYANAAQKIVDLIRK